MQLNMNTFHGSQLQSRTLSQRPLNAQRLQIFALKPVQGKVVSASMQKTAVVQVQENTSTAWASILLFLLYLWLSGLTTESVIGEDLSAFR